MRKAIACDLHGNLKCEECRKAKNRVRAREQHLKARETRLASMKNAYSESKKAVFRHYGNACSCCGESEQLFLTVDHEDGSGAENRGSKGGYRHNNIYQWLVRNGFPSGFQILCLNCNAGKYRNGGTCPHQEGSTTRAQARRLK